MSSLGTREKWLLEEFLGMGSGYVLGFSDRTFGEFCADAVDVDIHSDRYLANGTSKAKKLRAFWESGGRGTRRAVARDLRAGYA